MPRRGGEGGEGHDVGDLGGAIDVLEAGPAIKLVEEGDAGPGAGIAEGTNGEGGGEGSGEAAVRVREDLEANAGGVGAVDARGFFGSIEDRLDHGVSGLEASDGGVGSGKDEIGREGVRMEGVRVEEGGLANVWEAGGLAGLADLGGEGASEFADLWRAEWWPQWSWHWPPAVAERRRKRERKQRAMEEKRESRGHSRRGFRFRTIQMLEASGGASVVGGRVGEEKI